MKKGEILFVYGTLLKGERNDITKNVLIHSVSFLGNDKVNGKLYHMGAFPGFHLLDPILSEYDADAPCVLGEAYLIGDSSVTAILDSYEGYPYFYDRSQVISRNGRLVWVYIYNHPVLEDQLIETGDWKNPRLKLTHRIPILGEKKDGGDIRCSE